MRTFAVVLAPLFLGGCGMPVGVQIASLFADGLSFFATEKTLGDHGLSAVAGQDCAVWRGLNGENICRDNGTETAATGTEEPASASSQSNVMVEDAMADAPVEAEDVYDWGADEPKATPKTPEVAAVQEPSRATPEPAPTETTLKGGTFYVIASYRRIGYARRFASGQEGLAVKVLTGTARGLSVYRVAVGPVAKADHPSTHARLLEAGFHDVWALDLKNPKEAVELASLF